MDWGRVAGEFWKKSAKQPQNVQIRNEPDFVELIVTLPRSHEGRLAYNQLRNEGTRFEIEYVESLDEKLAALDLAGFLAEMPFSFHLVRTPAAVAGRAMRGILEWHNGEGGRGRVTAVEENETLFLAAGALGLPFKLGGFHGQYLKRMKVADAQREATRTEPVRVAILDSGSDATASLRIKDFYDVEPAGTAHHPAPPAPYDNDGHGTAMATLIQEVAPTAELYVVRVLDQAKVDLWRLVAGIGVAVGQCRADIVNMSLGVDYFIPKCRCGATVVVRQFAFEQFLSIPVPGGEVPLFVASTGNERSTNSFNFPASTGKCLAVGAVDSGDYRTTVSNYGSSSSYYAMTPGGKEDPALSLTIVEDVGKGGLGDPCFATSVSTAYATGMLALMRGMSAYGHLSNEKLLDELLQNHCEMPAHGSSLEYGSGVVSFSATAAANASKSAAGAAEAATAPDTATAAFMIETQDVLHINRPLKLRPRKE